MAKDLRVQVTNVCGIQARERLPPGKNDYALPPSLECDVVC